MAQTDYNYFGEYNFRGVIKGDTWLGAEFEMTDPDGVAIDLAGYSIRMHLRKTADQPEPEMIFTTEDDTIEIIDAAGGKFQIKERTIDLPVYRYVYDIEFTKNNVVRTWIRGTFPVKPEVTWK